MAVDIRALTGVRGVAAILVVLYHFGEVNLFDGGRIAYFPIPLGYMAVDLFFMLSGYVIALTYSGKFAVAGQMQVFIPFMIKRVARLYPAYLAISLLYIAKIVAGLSGGATLSMFSGWDVFGNLFMLTGWGLHITPLIGVAWAASAEMGSYLLAPLLLLLTMRRHGLVAVLVALVSFIGIYIVSISGKGSSGVLDVTSGDTLLPLVRAVAGFAIGMALYRVADIMDRLSELTQDILLCVLLALIVAAAIWHNDLLVYLLLLPLVLVLSRDGRAAQLLFGNAIVYRLGIISYSIYLLHPLFVSFAVQFWRSFGKTELAYAGGVAIYLAVILVLSEISYRFIEMPGRDIVAAWLKRRDRSASALRSA